MENNINISNDVPWIRSSWNLGLRTFLFAGRLTRANRTYRVQRRKAEQFQAGLAEIEKGRAGEGGRMEARFRGERDRRWRFLRDDRH